MNVISRACRFLKLEQSETKCVTWDDSIPELEALYEGERNNGIKGAELMRVEIETAGVTDWY